MTQEVPLLRHSRPFPQLGGLFAGKVEELFADTGIFAAARGGDARKGDAGDGQADQERPLELLQASCRQSDAPRRNGNGGRDDLGPALFPALARGRGLGLGGRAMNSGGCAKIGLFIARYSPPSVSDSGLRGMLPAIVSPDGV